MQDDGQLQATVEWLRDRGPAVILGNPQSLFVTQLGHDWRRLGLDVQIVSTGPDLPDAAAVGLPIIDSINDRPLLTRLARPVNVVLRPLETIIPRLLRQRYRRRTGRETPRRWELSWVDHYWDSYSRARAALKLKPVFVFAQEAAAYGLAAARCTETTRVIFPWGADIFLSCEASPIIATMIRRAFRNVDLIVPSSQTAKDRICGRFGVSPESVTPISWGVDLDMFQPIAGKQREAVRKQFEIPSQSVVLLNTRRFDPLWGGAEALEAAIRTAQQHPQVFCVFLGGGYDPTLVTDARDQVLRAGLSDRFRFFEQTVSLGEYAQLVGVADISLSLMTTGDMRSSSVLQAAAAGGVPVLGDTAEHRLMQEQGFACRLVDPDDRSSLSQRLSELVTDAELRRDLAARNRGYLAEHEDHHQQMARLLTRIAAVARNRTGE